MKIYPLSTCIISAILLMASFLIRGAMNLLKEPIRRVL